MGSYTEKRSAGGVETNVSKQNVKTKSGREILASRRFEGFGNVGCEQLERMWFFVCDSSMRAAAHIGRYGRSVVT